MFFTHLDFMKHYRTCMYKYTHFGIYDRNEIIYIYIYIYNAAIVVVRYVPNANK